MNSEKLHTVYIAGHKQGRRVLTKLFHVYVSRPRKVASVPEEYALHVAARSGEQAERKARRFLSGPVKERFDIIDIEYVGSVLL